MGKTKTGRLTRWARACDLRSLRVRWLFLLGATGVLVSAGWILVLDRVSESSHRNVQAARLDALARAATLMIDGDRLADPAARAELGRVLADLAAENRLERPLTLLDAGDEATRAAGLRVLVTTSTEEAPATRPYEPGLAPLFLADADGEAASSVAVLRTEDSLAAVAPVRDAFGTVVGLVRCEAPSTRPWTRRALFGGLAIVASATLLVLGLRGSNALLRRHFRTLEELAVGRSEGIEGRLAPRELRELAALLGEREVTGGEPAPAPTRRASRPRATETTPSGTAPGEGEVLDFEPALLLEEAVHTHRAVAAKRGVALSVAVGERVPARVVGQPGALLVALGDLLQNAVRNTRAGTIQVRVSRVLQSSLLRIEVLDSGAGVPWADQPALQAHIEHAAGGDPASFEPGVARACALVTAMGGKLGFESQPGSGSRFWFTAPGADAAEPALPAPRPAREAVRA
jgi:signal transduction histidine kinase